MNYDLLKSLLTHLEAYQAKHPKGSLEDFVVWLNAVLFSSSSTRVHGEADQLMTVFKLLHVNKGLKKLAKEALASSSVSSIDEYSFLLHLEHQDSFRKMEIIEMHNLEAPTGIEIIKRLLRNAFIEDFEDPEDKRAKRIRITKKGQQQLEALKPKMNEAFAALIDPLGLQEHILMNAALDKLIDH